MLIDEVHQKKTAIERLASEYGGKNIRVFGSVVRGEDKRDSDIDLLVDFPAGYDLFRQRMPLTEKLQQLLKRRVDLIPEHELNPHLRDQILSEAVEL